MKKILFLISVFLLTTANSVVTSTPAVVVTPGLAVLQDDYDATELPLGEGEEQSSEEDKDVSEDDDEAGLDHSWISRGKSNLTDLHILYQEILFQDLKTEVVIPPPKA